MLIDDPVMMTTTELVSKVKIVAHEQGVDGTWLGGSMITNCARMPEALITRELFDEHGPKPHTLCVVFLFVLELTTASLWCGCHRAKPCHTPHKH
jgi:hypothetical protein